MRAKVVKSVILATFIFSNFWFVSGAQAAIISIIIGQPQQIQEQEGSPKRVFIPNDPHFNKQTYLKQTKVEEAWPDSQGENVVIAVIDSGVDIDHPDLKDNIWTNPREIPGDNIDNDGNGFTDDINGWDFITNSADPNPKFDEGFTKEGVSHGTVVAGLAAAVGNNGIGISGAAPRAKIMPLRALDSKGVGNTVTARKAILYAIQQGADIINLSFVGPQTDRLFAEVIREAYEKGKVVVAAAGNDSFSEIDILGGNLDIRPLYPICLDGGPGNNYVLGVSAVDTEDHKSNFSNFGTTCVDLTAPGTDIISTQVYEPGRGELFGGLYSGYWSGTSFAVPLVSGAAALLKSFKPELTNSEIYKILINNTDNINFQNPFHIDSLGSGRLNAAKALAAIKTNLTQPLPQPPPVEISASPYLAMWEDSLIPKTMKAEEAHEVIVKFRNRGNTTWKREEVFLSILESNQEPTKFRSPDWQAPFGKISFQELEVPPNEVATFRFFLKAPKNPGNYKEIFKLQKALASNGAEDIQGGYFESIIVVENEIAAELVNHNFKPAVLKRWKSVPIEIKIKNMGTTQWNREDLILTVIDSKTKKVIKGPLEKSVKQGQIATYKFFLDFRKMPRGVQKFVIQFNSKTHGKILEFSRLVRID